MKKLKLKKILLSTALIGVGLVASTSLIACGSTSSGGQTVTPPGPVRFATVEEALNAYLDNEFKKNEQDSSYNPSLMVIRHDDVLFKEFIRSIDEDFSYIAFQDSLPEEWKDKSKTHITEEDFLKHFPNLKIIDDFNIFEAGEFGHITRMDIPDSVVYLNTSLTETNLTRVNLPSKLIVLGNNVFQSKRPLNALHANSIPQTLRWIGRQAFTTIPFAFDENYRELVLPPSLEYLGEDAFRQTKGAGFYNCTNVNFSLELRTKPLLVETISPATTIEQFKANMFSRELLENQRNID